MRWSLRRLESPHPGQKDPLCHVLRLKNIEPVINRKLVEEYCLILFSLRMIEGPSLCSLINHRGMKIMWRERKRNATQKLVTYLLTRCRREIIVPSEDIQKWVYIHKKCNDSCLCQNACMTVLFWCGILSIWFKKATIVTGQVCYSSNSHCK